MKKPYALVVAVSLTGAFGAHMSFAAEDDAAAIAAGQQLRSELQSKQIQCSELSDANYENLMNILCSR